MLRCNSHSGPFTRDASNPASLVEVDHELVLDLTISSKDLKVVWIDALTVGPCVSELLEFAGEQKVDAQTRSSDQSAQRHQDRADNIHW